jgi:ABC-type polysaccharide/polyol phosphate transport system ATPase subunit
MSLTILEPNSALGSLKTARDRNLRISLELMLTPQLLNLTSALGHQGMKRAEIKRQFDAIADFAEVEKFLDTPVKFYSSGMYVRLAFAVAAHLEPEILIVDEVLAVGDTVFQKKCLEKIG